MYTKEVNKMEEKVEQIEVKLVNLLILTPVLFVEEKYEEGIEFLDEFLASIDLQDGEEICKLKATVWFLKGLVYEKIRKYEKAEECYTKAENININIFSPSWKRSTKIN